MTVVVTVKNQMPQVATLIVNRSGLALKATAFEIEAQAKQRAPVRTGFLRANIQAEQHDVHVATVTAYASYSAYQEFGTNNIGPHPYMVPALEYVAKHANQHFKGLV